MQNWTYDKPTVRGFYWYAPTEFEIKTRSFDKPLELVRIDKCSNGKASPVLCVHYKNMWTEATGLQGQWIGPIEQPIAPGEQDVPVEATAKKSPELPPKPWPVGTHYVLPGDMPLIVLELKNQHLERLLKSREEEIESLRYEVAKLTPQKDS